MPTLRNFCIACVRAYRLLLSPVLFGLGVRCRFQPTCSEYAIGCFETHGAARGFVLALARLLRCHPLCPGGHDPVPGPNRSALSRSPIGSSHG